MGVIERLHVHDLELFSRRQLTTRSMQRAETILSALGQLPELGFGHAHDGVAEREQVSLFSSEGDDVGWRAGCDLFAVCGKVDLQVARARWWHAR